MGSIHVDLFRHRYINNRDTNQMFLSYCQTTWWSEKFLPPCNCDYSSLAISFPVLASEHLPQWGCLSPLHWPLVSSLCFTLCCLSNHRTQLNDFPWKAARELGLCVRGCLLQAAWECVSINVFWAGIPQTVLMSCGFIRSWPHHVDPKTTRHQERRLSLCHDGKWQWISKCWFPKVALAFDVIQ